MALQIRRPRTTDSLTSHPVTELRPSSVEADGMPIPRRSSPWVLSLLRVQCRRPRGRWHWTRSASPGRCAIPRRDPPTGRSRRSARRWSSSAATWPRFGRERRLPPRSVGRRSTSSRPRSSATIRARSAWPTHSAGWSCATGRRARPGRRSSADARRRTLRRDGTSEALRRLVEHPLDGFRGILGRVDRVLQFVVDVAPLDDLERLGAVAEQASDCRP